jgi:hypothetical protein
MTQAFGVLYSASNCPQDISNFLVQTGQRDDKWRRKIFRRCFTALVRKLSLSHDETYNERGLPVGASPPAARLLQSRRLLSRNPFVRSALRLHRQPPLAASSRASPRSSEVRILPTGTPVPFPSSRLESSLLHFCSSRQG